MMDGIRKTLDMIPDTIIHMGAELTQMRRVPERQMAAKANARPVRTGNIRMVPTRMFLLNQLPTSLRRRRESVWQPMRQKEHVSNAYAKAAEGNGQVVSASVTLRTGVCPECGRVYVAGGETNTTIKYPNETNPYQQERKSQDAADLTGARIDTRK